MTELQHSARLGKTFPVGWLRGLLGGWLRKAENKAKLSQLELEIG